MNTPEDYSPRSVTGTIRDAVLFPLKTVVPMGEWGAVVPIRNSPDLHYRPADIVFTDLGIHAVPKGEFANATTEVFTLPTAVSHGTGAPVPEQVRQARKAVSYAEVKELQIFAGKGPSSASRPHTVVWVVRRTRIGVPVVSFQFAANLPADEVADFLRRTPLAGKIKVKS